MTGRISRALNRESNCAILCVGRSGHAQALQEGARAVTLNLAALAQGWSDYVALIDSMSLIQLKMLEFSKLSWYCLAD